MASTAFGDGPSGFSFEASLIESWIPSSRSSSSMGIPGGYGVSVRIHSGTSRRRYMVTSARRRRRIRPQHFGTERTPCNRRQRTRNPPLGSTPAEVEEEVVLPRPLAERARLDLDEVDAVLREG